MRSPKYFPHLRVMIGKKYLYTKCYNNLLILLNFLDIQNIQIILIIAPNIRLVSTVSLSQYEQ